MWVYGLRFMVYDEQTVFAEADIDVPDAEHMKVAVNAAHNEFFSTIYVQTPQDLKIYSCLDG